MLATRTTQLFVRTPTAKSQHRFVSTFNTNKSLNLFTKQILRPTFVKSQPNLQPKFGLSLPIQQRAFSTKDAPSHANQIAGHKVVASAPRNPDIYQKHFYEYSSIGLLITLPTTLLLPLPAAVTFGMDMALAALLPFHSYLGINVIIDDYLPAISGAAKALNVLLTVLVVIGLLNLNMNGPGITQSLRRLWRKTIKNE